MAAAFLKAQATGLTPGALIRKQGAYLKRIEPTLHAEVLNIGLNSYDLPPKHRHSCPRFHEDKLQQESRNPLNTGSPLSRDDVEWTFRDTFKGTDLSPNLSTRLRTLENEVYLLV